MADVNYPKKQKLVLKLPVPIIDEIHDGLFRFMEYISEEVDDLCSSDPDEYRRLAIAESIEYLKELLVADPSNDILIFNYDNPEE